MCLAAITKSSKNDWNMDSPLELQIISFVSILTNFKALNTCSSNLLWNWAVPTFSCLLHFHTNIPNVFLDCWIVLLNLSANCFCFSFIFGTPQAKSTNEFFTHLVKLQISNSLKENKPLGKDYVQQLAGFCMNFWASWFCFSFIFGTPQA